MSFSEFDLRLPEPGSLYGVDAINWYLEATNRLRETVANTPADEVYLEEAWAIKSRLRYAAAMGFCDQENAADFLREHRLLSLAQLYEKGEALSPEDPKAGALSVLFKNDEMVAETELAVVNDTSSYQSIVAKEIVAKGGSDPETLILPPRPLVPNPEYLPEIKPFVSEVLLWDEPPKIGFAESDEQLPSLLVSGDRLWISYLTESLAFAIVQFSPYIEHQECRIGKLLPAHPYYAAGLSARAFNELSVSILNRYWKHLGGRHWVINFQDRTVDVVAIQAQVVDREVRADSSLAALQATLSKQ